MKINRGRECDETGTLTEEGCDRNQLDRRPDREDNSPPAVEAPAAGGLRGTARAIRNFARELPEYPIVQVVLESALDHLDAVAGYHEQMRDAATMTALARRLAEALIVAQRWMKVVHKDDWGQVVAALAEARKRGLIE